MMKPANRALIYVTACMALLGVVGLLARSSVRPKGAKPFFGPAPTGLALQFLGPATNHLKFDPDHSWRAFAVSNGTSKTLFCTVTEVDRRTNDGWFSAGSWISNTLAASSLMTQHETPPVILPGGSGVFFASVSNSVLPWRLHVGCFEAGWSDPLSMSVGKVMRQIQGLPPSNTKSWSGRRYELISGEISP